MAESPPIALASIYQSMVHSSSILFQNAISSQNQQNILSQAATTQGVMQVYSLDTVADTTAWVKILNKGK